MINQLLDLTRPLFVLDTETTGTDAQTDRVVEVGFQEWTAAGIVREWRSLVDPTVPIPPASTKTHGITDARVLSCRECETGRIGHEGSDHDFKPWPTFAQLAANLSRGFTDCDFAGQRVRFDLQVLAAEMARAQVAWDYSGARIIDSLRLEALAVPRSLGDLHEKYTGRKHDDAHSALSDARATATVIASQLETYDALPRDLAHLHRLQWPGWIDGSGKFRFVDGVACFSQWGKYANKPMRAAHAGYWAFILRGDFAPDVKRLAAEARMGRFPQEG